MVFDRYETKEGSDEPTDPNETREALVWLFNSEGVIDYQDGPLKVDAGGDNLVEFHDEDAGSVAYLQPGASGDIMSGGDSSGADATATYVTTDDESANLENSSQHANLSGADLHDPADHALGTHTESTLSELNALVSDATLDSEGDARPAEAHALGGAAHNSDTLANLNSKISDAVLDDESSARPPQNHDNTAHSEAYAVTLEDARSQNETLSGAVNFDGNDANNVGDLEFDRPQDALQTVSSATTSQTLDASQASMWDVTLAGDCTIDLSGGVSGRGTTVTLYLRQDGTGGHTVSWGSSIEWGSGSAPSLTTDAGTLSVVTFITADGGSSWQGFLGGDAFA